MKITKSTKRVKILKYVKCGKTWRFANVVENNGKVARDHVLIAGNNEHHPEGTYYIEWYEVGNRRLRKAVREFADLIDAGRRKAIEVEAMRAGVIGAETKSKTDDGSRLKIGAAIDSYLDFIHHNRAPRSYLTYRYTLGTLLRNSYTKLRVCDADRDDILKFMTDCYRQQLSNRTVYDKLVVVANVLAFRCD